MVIIGQCFDICGENSSGVKGSDGPAAVKSATGTTNVSLCRSRGREISSFATSAYPAGVRLCFTRFAAVRRRSVGMPGKAASPQTLKLIVGEIPCTESVEQDAGATEHMAPEMPHLAGGCLLSFELGRHPAKTWQILQEKVSKPQL